MKTTRKKKVLVVIGTRPEAIKLAPVIKELRAAGDMFITDVLITSQHSEILKQALDLFGLVADYDFRIMRRGQDLYWITSSVIRKFGILFKKITPDMVLVQGDTSTAMAAALSAFYAKIPVGHVEAGLRTYSKYQPYPEEINRRIIDLIADLCFTPTIGASNNLLREGIVQKHIVITGNTVIDSLKYMLSQRSRIRKSLINTDSSKKIILVTVHRRENIGEPLREICKAIKILQQQVSDLIFIYPVHPNPRAQKIIYGILQNVKSVHLVDPIPYDEMIYLIKRSFLILTDSGGLQEEAAWLGKPMLILREATERPEAVDAGVAVLAGTRCKQIQETVRSILEDRNVYKRMCKKTTIFGDGKAAPKIVGSIKMYFTLQAGKKIRS